MVVSPSRYLKTFTRVTATSGKTFGPPRSLLLAFRLSATITFAIPKSDESKFTANACATVSTSPVQSLETTVCGRTAPAPGILIDTSAVHIEFLFLPTWPNCPQTSHRRRFGFTSFWTRFGSQKSYKTTPDKPQEEPREGATSPTPDDRQVEVPGFDRLTALRTTMKRTRTRKAAYKCRVNGDCAKHEIASVRNKPYATPLKCASLNSFWNDLEKMRSFETNDVDWIDNLVVLVISLLVISINCFQPFVLTD